MAPSGQTPEPRDTPHLTTLDPERILRLLNQAGVEYVLIGGFAVVIHGYERLTGDLDICYARSRENVKRLVDVLQGLHAWPREWPQGLPFINWPGWRPPALAGGGKPIRAQRGRTYT